MKRGFLWFALFLLALALSTARAQDKAKASDIDWAAHFKPMGDVRLRYDEVDDQDKTMRERERIRVRFGLKAMVNDDFDIITQFGTGEAAGNGGDPISGNQTLTGGFTAKSVWLDLGYFDYHPHQIKGLDIDGGKMKNPFYIPGRNQLMWDHDLTPEGLALTYSNPVGRFQPFFNAGYFWVNEMYAGNTTPDNWQGFYGVQGGAKVNLAEDKFYVKAGVGYFDYNHLHGYPLIATKSLNNNSAALVKKNGASVYNNAYKLMEYNGEFGGKIGEVPWLIYGDYVVNNGITRKDDGRYIKEDPKDNQGYIVGTTIGNYDKPLGLALRYYYRYLPKDAVFAAFCDSDDSGGGTDNHGNAVGLDLGLYKNVWLSGIYYMDVRNISEDNAQALRGRNYHRLIVDLNVRF